MLHSDIDFRFRSLSVPEGDHLQLLFQLPGLHRDTALRSLDKGSAGLLECRAQHLLLHIVRQLIKDFLGLLIALHLNLQHLASVC